jgi:hypothetical protein
MIRTAAGKMAANVKLMAFATFAPISVTYARLPRFALIEEVHNACHLISCYENACVLLSLILDEYEHISVLGTLEDEF